MGNQLCCDPAVTKYKSKDSIEKAENQLQQFMGTHPNIKNVCKNPTKMYSPVDKTELLFFMEGVYIGRQIDNKRDGLGLMLYKSYGIYYQGQWKQDEFNGIGFMAHTNGDFYEGQWKKGLPHGKGIYVNSQNNWRYEGYWENGKQNGYGQETFNDGSKFCGDFKEGLRDGKGKYKNSQGDFIDGQFVSGEPQGFGNLVMEDFNYEGEWRKGEISGTGKSQWFNKEQGLQYEYVGEYSQGIKHGFGQYHDIGKNLTFKGRWEKGEMSSQGVFVEIKKKE